MIKNTPIQAGLAAALLMLAACQPATDAPIEATLVPGDPDSGTTMRFSPKAAAVALVEQEGGLVGSFVLGSADSEPIGVRLEKSAGAAYVDRLLIDLDRSGAFEEGEVVETQPNELRGKMWSSFEARAEAAVLDSTSGRQVAVPYPMSLWYVEDLRQPPTEFALRFTRRGWMQGQVDLGRVRAHIRVADADLDGVFTLKDDWALAEPDSLENLFDVDHDRPGTRHAWVGEQAYRLVSLAPTGQSAVLEAVDPGVTRAKEREDDDQLAVDRRAAHSGRTVVFEKDFAEAERTARQRGVPLFIDFETDWCGPCRVMEEWVFTADDVVVASESVVSVKVDGDEFPELAERFEVAAYPTLLLVDSDGQVRNRLVGYQGVEAMTTFLSDAAH